MLWLICWQSDAVSQESAGLPGSHNLWADHHISTLQQDGEYILVDLAILVIHDQQELVASPGFPPTLLTQNKLDGIDLLGEAILGRNQDCHRTRNR